MITFYTAPEVAKALKVSTVTVKREYERGNLNGFLVGNELRISERDFDDYCKIKSGQKTLREIQLEQELEDLRKELNRKNECISNIKEQLTQI